MKAILTFVSAICSLAAVATTYDWVGGASTVWNLADQNWTTDGGQTKCAFAAGGDAVFALSGSLNLTVNTVINPASMDVSVEQGNYIKLLTGGGVNGMFGTTKSVVKTGRGSLVFYHQANAAGNCGFSTDAILDIQEGTVAVAARNKGGQAVPRTIDLKQGATLQIAQASTLGNIASAATTSIKTAGQILFAKIAEENPNDFANVIKDLTIEPSATFVASGAGNAYFGGLLHIQGKVIVEGDGAGARTMTLRSLNPANLQNFVADAHAPLEFSVGDATSSPATDLTVTGPFNFYPQDVSASGTGRTKCGFRKTGAGTMLWQNSLASGNAAVDDVIGVESGALLFAAGQTLANATIAVSSGAAVGGSGTLGRLTLAEGAGLVAQKGQTAALAVSGDLALPAGGFVDFVADGELPAGTHTVPVLSVSGALTGDVSGWKVRVNGVETDAGKLTLTGGNLSVEVKVVLPDYVWTGAESLVWDLMSANWTIDGGSTSCAFVSSADAYFTTAADETVTVGAAVNPNAVFVSNTVGTLTIDLRSGIAKMFASTKSVVKQGGGTLCVIGELNRGTANFPEDSVLDIREGVTKIGCRNIGGQCSPRNIIIGSGATLQLADGNTLGNLGQLSPTSVRTAGEMIFDAVINGCANVVKDLTIEPGATFVADGTGHSFFDGILQIQEKVIVEGDGAGARTLALQTSGANWQNFVADSHALLEFAVGDATASPETDLTVTGPFRFYPDDKESSPVVQKPVGFRKTGAGTMLWQNSYATGNAAVTGDVKVEQGELVFASGQSLLNATVVVSAGAAVGGGATVGHLTLAEGARLCGQSGQRDALTVIGDVALPQSLTVDVSTADGMEPAAGFFARVLSVRGSLAGGDLSGWKLRVNGIERTDIPFCLKNGEILVGQAECVWTGAQDSVWDLTTENWTRDGVSACAFMSGLPAIFPGDKTETITFGATVNPANVCVSNAAGTLTFDYQNTDKMPFAQTMSVVKKGAGTLSIYHADKTTGTGGFPEGSVLDLQEGTVIADTRNYANKGCLPRQIIVHDGATLHLANASTVGNLGSLSLISVRTAGRMLFAPDPAKPANDFANVVKDLTIEPGATFVAEGVGNSYFDGILQIQEKVIVEGDGAGARTLALQTSGANWQNFVADAHALLEFAVGDATASPETDLTVTGPFRFYPEDKSGTKTGLTTTGFRKTGAGTMLWQNSYATGNAAVTGDVKVEQGELVFASGQSLLNATVVVSAGAAVGGGSFAGLTLAEGSGLVVASRRKGLLTVAGTVVLPATGKIVLDIPEGMDVSEFYGYFLKAPSYTGVENLKNWTLVAPGYEGPLPEDFTITQTDKGLCFGHVPGVTIIVR